MNELVQSQSADSPAVFARTAAGIALVAGLAMILGWFMDVDAVTFPLPAAGNMKANTALSFVISAVALWAALESKLRMRRTIVSFNAIVLFGIGAGTLAEYVFDVNLGIDELLARDPHGHPPGRMAHATATAFALLGTAFFLLGRRALAAVIATLCSLAVGSIGMLGYLFGVQAARPFEGYATFAPTTATLVVVVSAGLLCVAWRNGATRDPGVNIIASNYGQKLVLWGTPVLPFAWLWLHWEGTGYDRNGFSITLVVTLTVITLGAAAWFVTRSLVRVNQALQESEARFLGILESAVDAIIISDATGRIEHVNASTERMFGYDRGELNGKTIEALIPERFRATHRTHRDNFGERALAGPMRDRTLFGRRKDGSEFHAEISLSTWRVGERLLITSIVRDITQRRGYEAQLEYLANHDDLTGLANRHQTRYRLQLGIQYAQRYRTQIAVLYIDLDRFKIINDGLGHNIGDEVLRNVAARLKSCLCENDTIARMGSDEFVVILPELTQVSEIERIMQQVKDEMLAPVAVEGEDLTVTCSIGASIYPQDGTDPETLLKHADAAMHRAKELGRNRCQFFTSELNQRANERLSLENKLRHALRNGELLLHYQPQVEVSSGRIVGAEALLRWNSPELGMVAPNRFIPLAEETGLIVSIGEWVLFTACAQNQEWHSAGLCPIRVAVNLSARQFRERSLTDVVRRALSETGLPGQLLELELTESLAMEELDNVIPTLLECKAMGVSAAVDDFGTGYSSLAYLKRFAIDRLKIDRSFVQNITSDPSDATIAKTVISMAHSLKLKVVAEGVETREQLNYLQERSCDEMQGFLFGEPVPAEDFAQLLRNGIALDRTKKVDKALAQSA